MTNVSVLGIDLAKNVFELCGQDKRGKVLLRRKVRRNKLLECLAQLPSCIIGIEACGGSHHWAREFEKLGHTVRIIAPQYVKAYVKRHKNDRADAEAICEAVTRPTMYFVSSKTVGQQEIQLLHRCRERFVKARTALYNQARCMLMEFGIVLPKGPTHIRRYLSEGSWLQDERIPPRVARLLSLQANDLTHLESQLSAVEIELKEIYLNHPICRELAKLPGVGPLSATALLATVGNPSDFRNGRQFSAYLGLVPRQHSSGGREVLLGISKQGDRYLRTLLIHGARATLQFAARKSDRRSQWVLRLKERRGHNRAAVAAANKTARIAWALMKYQQPYQPAAM